MMEFGKKLKALEDHLRDDRQRLEFAGLDAKPYFVSYLLLSSVENNLSASNGEIVADERGKVINGLRAEVRVGNYRFDGCGSALTVSVPIEDDYVAMRNALWGITWPAFHMAHVEYINRCEECVDSDRLLLAESFSKVSPNRYISRPKQSGSIDLDGWRQVIQEASAAFNGHSEIMSSSVSLTAEDMLRIYVNSEGASVAQVGRYYYLRVDASSRAPEDNELLSLGDRTFTASLAELPSKEVLERKVAGIIENIMLLRQAPVEKPGSYPAVFDPSNTEVLFHEIVGHRLEGERQDRDWEGDTFEGRIGEKVAPDFVTLIDDPTRKRFVDAEGSVHSLVGHYRFDDEGVPASKVVLIQDGVLRNYLLSRHPVIGYGEKPNGHGRSDGCEDPIARMSNLVVRSSHPMQRRELFNMLIEECARQGKEYGLVFVDSVGGHTDTSEDNFRIFPQRTYRVWARDAIDKDTGREFKQGELQLVRGVEVAGTPLTILNNIVAMGDDYAQWPGYCGAESGWVKVAGIAPSSLFSRIEVKPSSLRCIENPLPKPSTYLRRR